MELQIHKSIGSRIKREHNNVKLGGASCSDATQATGVGNVSGSVTANSPIASTINNSDLSEGANSIRLCVTVLGKVGMTTQAIAKDITAPVAGSSGTITTANVTSSGLTLNWTKATDSVTAQASLQYKVVQSTSNNISTVADAETTGSGRSTVQNWSTDIATVNVTGLSAGTTYYFNVLVKDGVGNMVAYTTKSQTTLYTISGTVSGLTSSGLVLQNNGGDNLSVTSGATNFTFSTGLANGGSYTVTVSSQPSGLFCGVINGIGTATSNVTNINVTCGKPLKVADTGQTVCYNDSTTITCGASHNGQDAQYANKPAARSFTGPTLVGASDYITTDNVTGLVWKTCSEGQSGATCGTGTATNYNWTGATSACTALNSENSGAGYANRTDWHLPSIKELRTLPNYGTYNPVIDTSYFPATPNAHYWSSKVKAGDTTNAYYQSYDLGEDNYSLKTTNTYKARCVSGSIADTQSFTDNGNGTITDNHTGLIWQKCSMGQNSLDCSGSATTATWVNALSYCEGLELPTGNTSWRLPNINELKSLVDNRVINPSINNLFPNTVANHYRSSTTYASNTVGAWLVHFGLGLVFDSDKSPSYYVRCVSGP